MALDSTTAITFLGVQAWDEGTEENFVRTGNSTAVRTMLCAWEDRITIIDLIRGGGSEIGSVYVYTPSVVYPDAPFLPFDSIHVEGLPGEDGLTVGPNGMVGYPCNVDFSSDRATCDVYIPAGKRHINLKCSPAPPDERYTDAMPPKSSSSLGKSHLGPEDFNEGPQAAARFKAAVSHIAALPKSAVPRPQPQHRSNKRKK
jgi:hypothetical protein